MVGGFVVLISTYALLKIKRTGSLKKARMCIFVVINHTGDDFMPQRIYHDYLDVIDSVRFLLGRAEKCSLRYIPSPSFLSAHKNTRDCHFLFFLLSPPYFRRMLSSSVEAVNALRAVIVFSVSPQVALKP